MLKYGFILFGPTCIASHNAANWRLRYLSDYILKSLNAHNVHDNEITVGLRPTYIELNEYKNYSLLRGNWHGTKYMHFKFLHGYYMTALCKGSRLAADLTGIL